MLKGSTIYTIEKLNLKKNFFQSTLCSTRGGTSECQSSDKRGCPGVVRTRVVVVSMTKGRQVFSSLICTTTSCSMFDEIIQQWLKYLLIGINFMTSSLTLRLIVNNYPGRGTNNYQAISSIGSPFLSC